MVAPAFPATGRTTVGGVQLVDGEPVHRDLRTLLPGADVRDAETDADLEAIVRSVDDPSSVLWVGSAGLAAALGAVYPGAGVDEPRRRPAAPCSSSSAARTTPRASRSRGVAGVPAVVMPLDGRDVSAARHRRARARRRVRASSRRRRRATRARIAAALAETRRAGDRAHPVAGLVLTGGDTAVHVARRLGATGLLVEDELEPGVVLGRLVGPRRCRSRHQGRRLRLPRRPPESSAALAAGRRTRA